jgi:CRISPR type III-B/RAMP module RAMP protein Cmr6
MADNNLYDIKRTALPQDVKIAMSSSTKVDNFALLFNRMAHFGVKEDIGANDGNVSGLLNEEAKAHFFHKSKSKQKGEKHLDLTQKWEVPAKKFYDEVLLTHQAAAQALFSTHEEIKLAANWRIAVGLGNESVYENGFTFHPTYGIPYLPGTSLKGMTRHWAVANGKDKKLIEQIFGNENRPDIKTKDICQGRIIFFDAYPIELKRSMLQPDIMNNHYPDYYEGKKPPADWLSPRPIFFLTMKDVEFRFLLGVIQRPASKEEELDSHTLINTAKEWLENALFESGIGAKTAVGYGRMRQPATISTQAGQSETPVQCSAASEVKPEFQKGSSGKKLKNHMEMDAVVTSTGKPCKATVYGFGDKTYENVSVNGSVQNLKIGDVIKVTIQTDGKGERIISASFQGLKQHRP